MDTLSSLTNLKETFAVRLNDRMIIALEGEQADSYLHGQITINVNALSSNIARFYAHCDNKGKTWSVGHALRYDNQLLMLTNETSGQHSLAQLGKYGVFSKVDIQDITQKYAIYFVSSDAIQKTLTGVFSPDDIALLAKSVKEESESTIIQNTDGFAFSLGASAQGAIVAASNPKADVLQTNITDAHIPCFKDEVFNAIQISHVLPSLQTGAIAEYVPQMLNVHALNGIDFDKGCYMGQEVVARTRFLGKNKRAAFSFKIDAAIDVNSGDTLEKQLGDNWRSAGKVISVGRLGDETWIMAVLNNDTTTEDLHRLADNKDITCYPRPLPYDIQQQASNIVKKRR